MGMERNYKEKSCEICEKMFKPSVKLQTVCYDEKCKKEKAKISRQKMLARKKKYNAENESGDKAYKRKEMKEMELVKFKNKFLLGGV